MLKMIDRGVLGESVCASIESVQEAQETLERVKSRLDIEAGLEAQDYHGVVERVLEMTRELESLLRNYAPATDELSGDYSPRKS